MTIPNSGLTGGQRTVGDDDRVTHAARALAAEMWRGGGDEQYHFLLWLCGRAARTVLDADDARPAGRVDVMLDGDRPLWGYTCIDRIEFRWDQWMGCIIVCSHGEYRGISNGAKGAIMQSLARAAERFRQADVPHDFDW